MQYASIAGAALPFAMRLGTGAMTHGYGLGLAKNDECAPRLPSCAHPRQKISSIVWWGVGCREDSSELKGEPLARVPALPKLT